MRIPYAVLFDMDGTLLQTEKLATPAFQQTFVQLREAGLWDRRTPDESELVNILGMTIEQVWKKLLPGASEEALEAADRFLLENEIRLIHGRATDLYSAGRFQTSTKNDLVAKLLADYQVERAVMVGDRHSDMEAGATNGLFTIGCDFGFANPGELDGANAVITKFPQLLDHLPDIDTLGQSQT